MDADDWIDKTLLETCVDRMRETNADIVQVGVEYEQDSGKESKVYYNKGKDLLTRNDIKNDILNFWNENRLAITLHLFRKDTVKTIRFENIISGEDVDKFAYANIAYDNFIWAIIQLSSSLCPLSYKEKSNSYQGLKIKRNLINIENIAN